MKDSPITEAARAMGKKRFAAFTPKQLVAHQKAASRARWGKPRKKPLDKRPPLG